MKDVDLLLPKCGIINKIANIDAKKLIILHYVLRTMTNCKYKNCCVSSLAHFALELELLLCSTLNVKLSVHVIPLLLILKPFNGFMSQSHMYGTALLRRYYYMRIATSYEKKNDHPFVYHCHS